MDFWASQSISQVRHCLFKAGIKTDAVSDMWLSILLIFKFWPDDFAKAYFGIYHYEFLDAKKFEKVEVPGEMLYITQVQLVLYRINSDLEDIITKFSVLQSIKSIFKDCPNWFVILYYLCQCTPNEEYAGYIKTAFQFAKTQKIDTKLSKKDKAVMVKLRNEQSNMDFNILALLLRNLIKSNLD